MSSFRYKPSKPVAVLSALIGAAMIVFALTSLRDGPAWFLVVWCLFVAGIVGLNLWAAFSRNGSLATFTRVPDDDRP
ncbi:hypothetical protein [Blastococcus sp. SYSU D00820]